MNTFNENMKEIRTQPKSKFLIVFQVTVTILTLVGAQTLYQKYKAIDECKQCKTHKIESIAQDETKK